MRNKRLIGNTHITKRRGGINFQFMSHINYHLGKLSVVLLFVPPRSIQNYFIAMNFRVIHSGAPLHN